MKIEITTSFIQDLLFSACRYCIGRKTIMAAMLPDDIIKFLKDNPELLSDERKKQHARDIRREISYHIGLYDNVAADHWLSDLMQKHDLLSIISAHLEAMGSLPGGQDFFKTHKMKVYADEEGVMKVDIIDYDLDRGAGLDFMDFMDYSPWIRLACWLDPVESITVCTPDYIHAGPCISWPSIERSKDGDMRVAIRRQLESQVDHEVYIAPEYITKIH